MRCDFCKNAIGGGKNFVRKFRKAWINSTVARELRWMWSKSWFGDGSG